MNQLLKNFIEGYTDLFRLAPLFIDSDGDTRIDFDNPPGYAEDAANLAGDWATVGGYLRNAMEAETRKTENV